MVETPHGCSRWASWGSGGRRILSAVSSTKMRRGVADVAVHILHCAVAEQMVVLVVVVELDEPPDVHLHHLHQQIGDSHSTVLLVRHQPRHCPRYSFPCLRRPVHRCSYVPLLLQIHEAVAG